MIVLLDLPSELHYERQYAESNQIVQPQTVAYQKSDKGASKQIQ